MSLNVKTAGGEALHTSSLTAEQAEELDALRANERKLQDAEGSEEIHSLEAEYVSFFGVGEKPGVFKKLAARVIPRFARHFPEHFRSAVEIQLDICEDQDELISSEAIMGIPKFCSKDDEDKSLVGKLADVLGQLLTRKNVVEVERAKEAIRNLADIETKGVIQGLFRVATTAEGEADPSREAVVSFLKNDFLVKSRKLDDESEEVLAEGIRLAVSQSDESEFKTFIQMLSRLRKFKDAAGAQEIVDLIVEQAKLESFDFNSEESTLRVLSCMDTAKPFYKKGASASVFAKFIVNDIFPKILVGEAEEKVDDRRIIVFMKAFADMSPFISQRDLRSIIDQVYNVFKHYIVKDKKNIQCSFAECILYAFHAIAGRIPTQLNTVCGIWRPTGQPSDFEESPHTELLEDFIARCKYTLDSVTKGAKVKTGEKEQEKEEEKKEMEEGETVDDTEIKRKKAEQEKKRRIVVEKVKVMLQPLCNDPPKFIGMEKLSLSWNPQPKTAKRERDLPARPKEQPVPKRMRGPEGAIYRPPGAKEDGRGDRRPMGRGRGGGGFGGRRRFGGRGRGGFRGGRW